MKPLKNNAIIEQLAKSLEIPDSAYETAKERYESLATWLGDEQKSRSASHDPHVFPQGSFRLGTVNRPINENDDFDLDLSCCLRNGISETSHSQEDLKSLLGFDLENYRKSKGIHSPTEEKRRCWRLNYKDKMSFHIDAVPAIPASFTKQATFEQRMMASGREQALAKAAAEKALSITDNEEDTYNQVQGQWHSSNPEGYALWFEEQIKKNQLLTEEMRKAAAQADPLPTYKFKSTLQKCIQILKRHRDMMYEKQNQDSKPISIIITTLAARSYEGEEDLTQSLFTILENMEKHIKQSSPKVPNPVNPHEDFADKWDTEEGLALRLEFHFKKWLKQAQDDFNIFADSTYKLLLEKTASRSFSTSLDEVVLTKQAGTNRLNQKAALINSKQAFTSASGIVGTAGIKNQTHNFYGEEKT